MSPPVCLCALLCSSEIHMCSDTANQWLFHVFGAKDIIKATKLESRINEGDVAVSLDWVYYHDALARFSILHWRHDPIEATFYRQNGVQAWQWSPGVGKSRLSHLATPSHRMLEFVVHIFDTLLESFNKRNSNENFPETLQLLEYEVNSIPNMLKVTHSSSVKIDKGFGMMIELYQIAILIYLARVSESMSGQPRDMKSLLDRAFALLDRMHTCERLFPLFILGCEASTDERRIGILKLIQRTVKYTHMRNIDCFEYGIKSIWIQDDLNADQELKLDYIQKLSVIISSAKTLPSLV